MNKNIPYELIIRSFRNSISEKETKELDSWLSEEGNKLIYEKLHKVWDKARSNAEDGLPDVDDSWKKFRNSTEEGYGRGMKGRFNAAVFSRIAVAAAIVAVAFFAGTRFTDHLRDVQDSKSQEINVVRFSSATGKSTVTLPDGTLVTLQKGSSLAYNSDFGKADRKVSLSGDAFFDVVKNPQKMFRVNISDIEVDVHGTAFNIDDNTKSLTVSLLRGAVNVGSASGLECNLNPGQKVLYDKSLKTMTVSATDAAFDALWSAGSLSFDKKNLDYVCRYLSQWYGKTITPSEAVKGKFAYTFSITDESLEEILNLMKTTTPIRYRYTNNENILIY